MSQIQVDPYIEFQSFDQIYNYMKNNKKLLLLYEDDVIDVTEFAETHPGINPYKFILYQSSLNKFNQNIIIKKSYRGKLNLQQQLGSDIKSIYFDPQIHVHSTDALQILKSLKIGTLNDYDIEFSVSSCESLKHIDTYQDSMIDQETRQGNIDEFDSSFDSQINDSDEYPEINVKYVKYRDFHLDRSLPLLQQIQNLPQKQYNHLTKYCISKLSNLEDIFTQGLQLNSIQNYLQAIHPVITGSSLMMLSLILLWTYFSSIFDVVYLIIGLVILSYVEYKFYVITIKYSNKFGINLFLIHNLFPNDKKYQKFNQSLMIPIYIALFYYEFQLILSGMLFGQSCIDLLHHSVHKHIHNKSLKTQKIMKIIQQQSSYQDYAFQYLINFHQYNHQKNIFKNFGILGICWNWIYKTKVKLI